MMEHTSTPIERTNSLSVSFQLDLSVVAACRHLQVMLHKFCSTIHDIFYDGVANPTQNEIG